ncbi:MAG: hypothetical protein QXR58_02500 [Candidatus Micrarchaeaceae archaeon]
MLKDEFRRGNGAQGTEVNLEDLPISAEDKAEIWEFYRQRFEIKNPLLNIFAKKATYASTKN